MVVPPSVDNDVFDAIDLLASAGLELLDWQALLLECWLGVNERGRWAASTCGNEGPRQNGKTRDIQGRAAVEMLVFGGTPIYTAQLQKTSTETFEETASLFDTPALRKYLAKGGIRTALGREEIRLKNGAKMKFLARTRNGGNGQHGSLLIFDEAQYLQPNEQGSFMPAISACRTPRGPQTIYCGNAPEESDYGLVFEKIRRDALDGRTKRTAWTAWTIGDDKELPDISNRELWKATNPSLGVLLDMDTIEGEYETMLPEQFAHQRLGWFRPRREEAASAIPATWEALAVDRAPDDGVVCFGVKFSADGTRVCVAGVRHFRDRDHVELIFDEPMTRGVAWLAEWINSRASTTALVLIDGKSGAGDLVNKLDSMRYPQRGRDTASAEKVSTAASMMVNAVIEETVTHLGGDGQASLNDSARTSTKRPIGSGFGFDGRNCTPIEAASLALLAARTTTRNPERKGRMG